MVLIIVPAACSSDGRTLRQIQKSIVSLRATTIGVGEAWLKGDVSPTYAGAAFRQTLQLVDEQRASLNSAPRLLLDPRGATLSRETEQLSRVLAALIDAAAGRSPVAAHAVLVQVRAGEESR